jgi:prepilin-type N-terminal cleavage/methylation domain-containing protein
MLQRSAEKMRARHATGEGGFTLVELIVVIAILAILSAIVVFAVGGITDKGQTSACKTDRQAIETAEEAYYANQDPGAYTDMAGLVPKYLHEASTYYDVNPNAAGSYDITPVAGGKCT